MTPTMTGPLAALVAGLVTSLHCVGMCGGIVAGFFIVVLACHGLGNNCLLSPALAAWAPLVILTPIAVLLSEPLRA